MNLSEIRLFNSSGQLIPTDKLGLWMSSVQEESWFPNGRATLNVCFDGVEEDGTANGNYCQPQLDDPDPRMRISYPCSEGLSSVQVVNIRYCCMERINNLRMRFLDAVGNDAAPFYGFTGGVAVYNIGLGTIKSQVGGGAVWLTRRAALNTCNSFST